MKLFKDSEKMIDKNCPRCRGKGVCIVRDDTIEADNALDHDTAERKKDNPDFWVLDDYMGSEIIDTEGDDYILFKIKCPLCNQNMVI